MTIEYKFKVGDSVVYTNDFGVTFEFVITSLHNDKDHLFEAGYRYYLNKESYWMPVRESNLKKVN